MAINDYAELKEKYIGEDGKDIMSEKQVNNSDELLIKSNVKNPILKEFLNRLEQEYGCLLTNSGTVIKANDRYIWFSVKAITIIVSELDKELRENNECKI